MLNIDAVRTVPELLAEHAHAGQDKVAFVDDVTAVTYGDLDTRTSRLAGHLLAAGLKPQERVLMYLDNSVEVAEGYLAAPRSGLVTVCANPAAPAAELAHILTDSAARAVLTDQEHLDTVLELVPGTDVDLVIVTGAAPVDAGAVDGSVRIRRYDDLMAVEPDVQSPDSTGLDEWCWMLYTSGTTGRPKGVKLTQRSCLWVVAACWSTIADLGPDDLVLSPLPLFHSYALVLCVLAIVATGASERILRSFSPSKVLDLLANEPVTFFPGVPTMFRYLIDRSPTDRIEAPHLRLCVSAGANMSADLNAEFEEFAQVRLLDGYGITETSTMVTLNSPTASRVLGSCGMPLPGLTVRLVDPASLKDVAPGDEGEIWVQGPNVMLGYHNLDGATADVLTNGWYRTGDLGQRDEHGFLRISGRVKELIIRGGENIYPAEVEAVLQRCDGVADAAVVGAPHPMLGEVPVAYVVPPDGSALDHEAVLSACRKDLSYFKVPAELIEVNEIPRTGSGKIRRFQLTKNRPELPKDSGTPQKMEASR
ncbi:class I adenylate-forming enzyme family protein [Georgenia sp. Z1491]|uniref:class I adenylate-forming enzyme family protein n=1 Tax=Georgenia sp. Z1491 TaxID=3416707 RepID=UPI003CF49742